MKSRSRKELVCRPFCRFYKEGGEEETACAGLLTALELLDEQTLERLAPELDGMLWDASRDELLAATLCSRCDFRVDGCGFREGEPDSPPCGGYVLIELLLRRGRLRPGDLDPEKGE